MQCETNHNLSFKFDSDLTDLIHNELDTANAMSWLDSLEETLAYFLLNACVVKDVKVFDR